jgi:hypothetical protein
MKMKLVAIPIEDGVCDIPDEDCLVLGLTELTKKNDSAISTTVHAVAILVPIE